jgi:hypothetical protein
MSVIITAAALMAVAMLGAQAPTFHAGTRGVVIPVAVFDGDQVVRTLTAQDFQVHDNGAPQVVTSAELYTLPIDLRLAFDISGSISEEELGNFISTMRQVASTLEPRDRCEILTFNTRVAQAAAAQSPPVKIEFVRGGFDGTSFFDAVILALATVPTPDRRQITIILSDAKDNRSFFDEPAMLESARRTDAVVYTILPGDPKVARSVSANRLQALSVMTGGRLVLAPERSVGERIIDAIEEFRQSYAVRYTWKGTTFEGWHKLEVKVPGRPSYRVRAKSGYFGR